MNDNKIAIRVIIENELCAYIRLLKEQELDKKDKSEYINKINAYIDFLCRKYNFNSALFLSVFIKEFIDRIDKSLNEVYLITGQGWDDGTDRKIKNIIGRNSNYVFL